MVCAGLDWDVVVGAAEVVGVGVTVLLVEA